MIIGNRQKKIPMHIATAAEKAEYAKEVDKKNPGYLDESTKLITIVRILTVLRVMYGIFYLYIVKVYILEDGQRQAWYLIASAFVFLFWYSWMLHSGKIIALLMLMFRGYGIVTSGASLMAIAPWLPLPLIFTVVFPIVLEFVEAVFCIYILFNNTAAQTVRLNVEMDRHLLASGVPRLKLEEMADYKNPYDGEEDQKKQEEQKESGE